MSETSSRIEPVIKILVDVADLERLLDLADRGSAAAIEIDAKYRALIERARRAR